MTVQGRALVEVEIDEMNYRYAHGDDASVRAAIARNPTASLHELRQSHPTLRAMSLDHLAVRVDQVRNNQTFAALK